MGVVYLAHDPRIDRQIAIKTIQGYASLPPREADEMRQRLQREAQAAGKLQHPGIVTIYDVGEHEGTSYIAMEYIEGRPLDQFTGKGKLLPVDSVVKLMVQACEALDYAHSHGVVHRDIKPANMMMLGSGQLKITDFGLAKNPASQLTQDGILVGSPNYMSPEQVLGRPLDGRSDLFSLAAVMYELLTGERPFPGDTVTTIIYRILSEHPAPPHMVNEGVDPAIAKVLARALAKEPAQRYQTGAELTQALLGHGVELLAEGVGATRPMRAETRGTAGHRSSTASGLVVEPSRTPSVRSA